MGAHKREVTIVAAQSLEPTDEDTEARRVEEVDTLEVDDDLVPALAYELHQLFPEPRSSVDIDLPLYAHNRVRLTTVVHLETELHQQRPFLTTPIT